METKILIIYTLKNMNFKYMYNLMLYKSQVMTIFLQKLCVCACVCMCVCVLRVFH